AGDRARDPAHGSTVSTAASPAAAPTAPGSSATGPTDSGSTAPGGATPGPAGRSGSDGRGRTAHGPAAVQAGGARADRGADPALPGCAGGADDDGIDVSARGHPGGPAREGQPEPQGHSPQRRAEEVRLGRQREVVVQLSADSQPAERKDRLDAEARRRLPRSEEGHHGRHSASAREGAG